MQPSSHLSLTSLALSGLLTLSACTSNEDDLDSTAGTNTAGTSTAGTSTAGTNTAGTNTAGTTTAGTNTAGTNTAGTNTAGTTTAGTTTAGTTTAGTTTAGTEITYPELTDCAELNDPSATTCFANADCPEDRRCQDVGPSDYPTPCCVPGARGGVPAGEVCDPATGERECASALCISSDTLPTGLCSGVCATDADCPANLPRCLSVAFSGSALMFCSPSAP